MNRLVGLNPIMDDPIRSFQATQQQRIEAAERLRPLIKACEEASTRAGLVAHVSVNLHQGRPRVHLSVGCKDLKEIVPLFRELAKEGLKVDKGESHRDSNLFDVVPMREYNLGPDLMVVAMIMGGKEGPNCRMEQVGVKEVPVYEMKCGD